MKPDAAAEIVRKLKQHGHEAYFVGGCVRDMVLGLEPADYDIATSAPPGEVSRIFPRTEPIGVQFGVVLVIQRGHPFEVATFRSDQAYIDGRRPSGVVFSDARQDVWRRDFTINGLLFDPDKEQIIDYVSGQEDIRRKVIRAIGDPRKRFEEDKLRVLRAVRFASRLSYSIEPETWAAIAEMAPLIHQVSAERIREEIVRILTEGEAARGFEMLAETGLRQEILPELEWTPHIAAALRLLQRGALPDLAMAVLLHETEATIAEVVVERLKFSRAETNHIVSLVANRTRFNNVATMSTSGLKRFFRLPRFEDHLELERIHALAGDGDFSRYEFAWSRYSSWSPDDIRPSPLITGEDLIALGYRPGPLFKQILTRIEDEQLEGRLSNRDEALALVGREFGGGD